MTLDQMLAEVDHLSPEEREKLRTYLTQHVEETKPRSVQEWITELEDIAREFRGDSSNEEMQEIIAAMTMKSKPSEKGL